MEMTRFEIVQVGGADQAIEDAKAEFRRRFPNKGEPVRVAFEYAYPAARGENRTVGMVVESSDS